jgi:putative membrane protein
MLFQRLALILFCIYLAVFPGSTITVALNRVPDWGAWMGGALLLLQGGAALCWLLGSYRWRGALAALLVFLLAWGVEYLGVTTGLPFGRYYYTAALQPQFFGLVPAPITCAWLMVAIGSWQLATTNHRRIERSRSGEWRLGASHTQVTYRESLFGAPWSVARAATLVLLLDLQIETVATRINRYWVWVDNGPYYGVPSANFVAWWLVGLGMAMLVDRLLFGAKIEPSELDQRPTTRDQHTASASRRSSFVEQAGIVRYVGRLLPALLYLMSTLMFTIVNLARGYTLAGLVGAAVLLVAALYALPARLGRLAFLYLERTKHLD